MRVIVGCEFSQIVTKAFRDKGHEAYSCDLLPTEGNPAWHFQCDIFELLKTEQFDLGIFHPECTYLTNSGVRWLHERPERWELMRKAAAFFNACLDADIPKVCVENPIQHKYARELIRKYDQLVQPYMFGDPESKATCLWLKNLPLLHPTKPVMRIFQSCFKEAPSPDRWKNRSRTFVGIAEAMADQWG